MLSPPMQKFNNRLAGYDMAGADDDGDTDNVNVNVDPIAAGTSDQKYNRIEECPANATTDSPTADVSYTREQPLSASSTPPPPPPPMQPLDCSSFPPSSNAYPHCNSYYDYHHYYSSWNIRSSLGEILTSAEVVFLKTSSKVSILLVLGPIAVVADSTGWLGEAACFALAGAALIPCAERLSFITEQVAEHTNGTIGALLNATFGNAPELLISVAALRSGFYRVVQLAMLGSILTNMMLVFGVACLIGGFRWQVQDLRRTSGNISVVMLLVSTAGFLLPAALLLSGQFASTNRDNNINMRHYYTNHYSNISQNGTGATIASDFNVPTDVEIRFCRVNAAVMMILYVLFLVFTLGTHKDEFDDQLNHSTGNHVERRAKRNLFCLFHLNRAQSVLRRANSSSVGVGDGLFAGMELMPLRATKNNLQHQHRSGTKNHDSVKIIKAKSSERGEEDIFVNLSQLGDDGDDLEEGGVVLFQTPARRVADINGIMRVDSGTNSNSSRELHKRSSLGIGSNQIRGSTTTNLNTGSGGITGVIAEDCSNGPILVDEGSHYQFQQRQGTPRIGHRIRHSSSCPDQRSSMNGGHNYQRQECSPVSVPVSTLKAKSSSFGQDVLLGGIGHDHLSDADDDAHVKHKNNVDNTNDYVDEHLGLEDLDATSVYQDSSCSGDVPLLSMRAGIFWLFVLTLCISALSDIIVDTIDGFAERMNLSEVFTSMVVLPFFSNVAEQVSAFIFAYRNEMDLVVGVTIGSAIQIASFVLPGSVLIGMMMDRSMTLYFRAYETVCMLFGVIVVGAILQGGTTNWLVGAVLVGIYIIMATGIWFHEMENLSVDGEDLIRNATMVP